MKIAEIKNYAWKHMDDHSIGFEFKGKHITYPWLDFEKQAFDLTTLEAIMTYGYDNIKNFCGHVAPLCSGSIPNIFEWSGKTELSETTKWAYDRWCEDEVLYRDGQISGLSI